MRRLTDNTQRHSHLPDAATFDVFVGKGDSQWLSTIYEDVVTQRSKLFASPDSRTIAGGSTTRRECW
jgi:hypothetical protein